LKNVIVIGAGFAGMSAATHLAQRGYSVTVLEKNAEPGGRCRSWTSDGFTFDMGPSWYWMPDVFEQYFRQFGKQVSDYYHLERLDPSYRVFFNNAEHWDIPAGSKALGKFLETIEPGAANNLKAFLKEAAYKYDIGISRLVHKPGRRLSELIDPQLISGLFKLDVFKSMSKHIRSLFKDERIIQLLEFPVLFLGAKPSKTPALYSLMNYADIELGTWYPKGGMVKISEAMFELAKSSGVQFKFNAAVTKVDHANNEVKRVYADAEYEADIVVGGADYHHLDREVLDPQESNYTEAYWEKRVMAPSSLLYFIGLDRKVPGLQHHNLFFDTDFQKHAEQIYDHPEWPNQPLFYVSATSKTDPETAPEGGENLFVLIPVAPGMEDSPEIKERFYHLIMERLETRLGIPLREHVVVRRDYAHSNFIEDYNAYKGNAYGLANTLTQTAHLKPSLKNKHLTNWYYTGQLTVPGPGVPPALISGKVVAGEIIKEHPLIP